MISDVLFPANTLAQLTKGGREAKKMLEREPQGDVVSAANVSADTSVHSKQPDSSGKSTADLRDAVKKVNDFIKDVRRDLVFQIDESTHEVVVKVTDRESGDVIRQMPPEEVLNLRKVLSEVASHQNNAGILVKTLA